MDGGGGGGGGMIAEIIKGVVAIVGGGFEIGKANIAANAQMTSTLMQQTAANAAAGWNAVATGYSANQTLAMAMIGKTRQQGSQSISTTDMLMYAALGGLVLFILFKTSKRT